MNSSIFRFNLDLHTTQSQISIPVSQGDTNRTWKISFTNGENPVKLGEGSIATLSIKRPGGTYILASCAIENESTVVYDFAQNKNTAIENGIHRCDVTLYNSYGLEIGSPKFTMIVDEKAVDSDDINISENDLAVIAQIVIAEAAREEAEKGRVNAEAARVLAENGRVTAEEARQKATAEAIKKAEDAAEGVVNGKSAYESARDQGYEGTEEEFGKGLALVASVTVYDGEMEDIE